MVMWEILTGTRLYRRDSDFENMTAIVSEPPPKLSSRRSEVPRAVDDIVLRLLAKSVNDRFQTAGEVVEAIEDTSMRAGTTLSTSSISRLIRHLFGTRAEPWLELLRDFNTQTSFQYTSWAFWPAKSHARRRGRRRAGQLMQRLGRQTGSRRGRR